MAGVLSMTAGVPPNWLALARRALLALDVLQFHDE
jgi:hypothetical protein